MEGVPSYEWTIVLNHEMNPFIMKIGLFGSTSFSVHNFVCDVRLPTPGDHFFTLAKACGVQQYNKGSSLKPHPPPGLKLNVHIRLSAIDFIASNEIRKFRDFSTSFLLLSILIRLGNWEIHSMQLRCYQRWITKLSATHKLNWLSMHVWIVVCFREKYHIESSSVGAALLSESDTKMDSKEKFISNFQFN